MLIRGYIQMLYLKAYFMDTSVYAEKPLVRFCGSLYQKAISRERKYIQTKLRKAHDAIKVVNINDTVMHKDKKINYILVTVYIKGRLVTFDNVRTTKGNEKRPWPVWIQV